MARRFARALVLGFALGGALVACGGAPPARDASSTTPPPPPSLAPWFGAVVDRSRDFVVEVAPRALAADPAYGPLFRRAAAVAAAQGGPLAGSTLDVLEQSDDVLVAVRADGGGGSGREVVAIVAGAPASADPAKVLTETGEPAFVLAREARRDGDVAELVARHDATSGEPSTLFVLPGRTWILGMGAAAARVRSALERTAPATPYRPDTHALLEISLGADVLTAVRARVGPALAPVAEGLVRAAISLTSGTDGHIRAQLVYGSFEAARVATPRVRALVARLVERLLPGTDPGPWLAVEPPRPGAPSVVVSARVPSTVLRALAESPTAP